MPSNPDALTDFYCLLLSGQGTDCPLSNARQRLVKYFSEDIIYAVPNGRVKTGKRLTVGLAVKSLMSSRKVLEVLNKNGHCCKYATAEEIENVNHSSPSMPLKKA